MKTNLRTSQNELEILGLIHARRAVSRAGLVKLTGLSAGLISAVVRRLIARDLVMESGLEQSKLGRRRVALRLSAGATYTVGIEIGTFFLRIVISDLAGNVCHRLETHTMLSDGFSRVMERCFKNIDQAVNDCGVGRDAIVGIGVAHSGVVDSDQGIVLSFPRPGQMAEWRNVALREMVEEKLKLPCVVEDSVRMGGFGRKAVWCTWLPDRKLSTNGLQGSWRTDTEKSACRKFHQMVPTNAFMSVDGSIGKYTQAEVRDSTHPETAPKSNGFRRIIGLSSHYIRLMDVAETGLRMYLAEKKARKGRCRTRPDNFSGPV